jgi:5'-deoxynucleotidase YfbR-like HD superfamily hydrolase
MADRPSPTEEARRLYEDAEARTASAMEQLVARESFGELLARVTENVLAVVKISNDAADLVVRNLRLAGRRDVTGLARQIARTEDKLELLLQEVERLQQAVEADSGRNGAAPARTAGGARSGSTTDDGS